MRIILSKILITVVFAGYYLLALAQPISAAGQTDWQRFIEFNNDRFQLILPGSSVDESFDIEIALGENYDLNQYFIEPSPTAEPERIYIDVDPELSEPEVYVVVPAAPQVQPIVTQPSSLDPLFEKYGTEYNISSQLLKDIAQCESGLNAGATNGPYGGMFQFTTGTWISNRQAMGLDTDPGLRFNGEEAIRTAAFKIARDGIGAWPACGRRAVASIELSES